MDYQRITEIQSKDPLRYRTGFSELDKILNGGLVSGAVVLIAGEPGAGKSTLLIQIACHIAESGLKVLYVSGEENLAQIKQRATRLGTLSGNLFVSEETNIELILEMVNEIGPKVVILDSLQTLASLDSNRAAGTPTQMKLVLEKVIRDARGHKRAIVAVGHATKGGNIGGLQTLQHMVDATFYLDANGSLRTLEVKKNRFGASFVKWGGQMTDKGIVENRWLLTGDDDEVAEQSIDERVQEILLALVLLPFLLPPLIVWEIVKAISKRLYRLLKGGEP